MLSLTLHPKKCGCLSLGGLGYHIEVNCHGGGITAAGVNRPK